MPFMINTYVRGRFAGVALDGSDFNLLTMALGGVLGDQSDFDLVLGYTGENSGAPADPAGLTQAPTGLIWDVDKKGASVLLSPFKLAASAPNRNAVLGSNSRSTGIWQYEVIVSGAATQLIVGIANTNATTANFPGFDNNAMAYSSNNGSLLSNNTTMAYGAAFTSGDVIGVSVNTDTKKVTFYKNGVSQGEIMLPFNGPYFPIFGAASESSDVGVATIKKTAATYPVSGATFWDNTSVQYRGAGSHVIVVDTAVTMTIPAAVKVGDLLVATLMRRYPYQSAPTGWTLVSSSDAALSSPFSQYTDIWMKTATATDTAGSSVTFSQASAGRLIGAIAALYASSGTPILEVQATQALSGVTTASSINVPQRTSKGSGRMAIALASFVTASGAPTATVLAATVPSGTNWTAITNLSVADNRMASFYLALSPNAAPWGAISSGVGASPTGNGFTVGMAIFADPSTYVYDALPVQPVIPEAKTYTGLYWDQNFSSPNMLLSKAYSRASITTTGTVLGSISRSAGISQYEVTVAGTGGKHVIGFATVGVILALSPGSDALSVGYCADGTLRKAGANTAYGAPYTNGDVITCLFNATTNRFTFYKNGVSQGDVVPPTGTGWFPAFGANGDAADGTMVNLNASLQYPVSGTLLWDDTAVVLRAVGAISTVDSGTGVSPIIPASAQIGDLLLLVVMHRSVLNPAAGPGSWGPTSLSPAADNATGLTQFVSVFSKTAASGEPGVVVGVTQTTANRMIGVVLAFTSTTGNVTLEAQSTNSSSNLTDTPLVVPTVTAQGKGRMGVDVYSSVIGSTSPATNSIGVAPTPPWTLVTPLTQSANRLGVANALLNNGATTSAVFSTSFSGVNGQTGNAMILVDGASSIRTNNSPTAGIAMVQNSGLVQKLAGTSIGFTWLSAPTITNRITVVVTSYLAAGGPTSTVVDDVGHTYLLRATRQVGAVRLSIFEAILTAKPTTITVTCASLCDFEFTATEWSGLVGSDAVASAQVAAPGTLPFSASNAATGKLARANSLVLSAFAMASNQLALNVSPPVDYATLAADQGDQGAYAMAAAYKVVSSTKPVVTAWNSAAITGSAVLLSVTFTGNDTRF